MMPVLAKTASALRGSVGEVYPGLGLRFRGSGVLGLRSFSFLGASMKGRPYKAPWKASRKSP